jgi:hypothetical protein
LDALVATALILWFICDPMHMAKVDLLKNASRATT